MEEPRARTSMSARAVAGVAGAVLTNALLTPLDVLKIRQQNFVGNGSTHNFSTACTGCGHFSRNKGGLIDRFLCTASRSSTASSVSRLSTAPPSLCGLCGNYQHHAHSHSLWERCTPPKKKFTTHAHSHIQEHSHIQAHSTRHAATASSNSMLAIFRSVVKHDGVSALWDGLKPALLLSSINVVLYMIAYDELSKDILPNKMGWSMDTSTIVAGGVSRAFSALIVSPLELIRTQQQSSNALAKQGVLRGMQNIIRKDGALSLWRGYTATCWRDVPFSIVYWYGFEAFKARISDPTNNIPIRHNSFLTSFVAGGGSGMIAAFVTTPMDVVKTRRQVMVGSSGGEARTARLLLDILRSEGVSALFSGVVPRVVKVAPACGLVIGTYSYVQELAGRWI